MVRKSAKSASTYTPLTAEDVKNVVLATSGKIKDKEVDPRKLVGTIHIKKYLASTKINGTVESWIAVLKKAMTPVEGTDKPAELTAEELELLEQCKAAAKVYVEEEASASLKKKVAESKDEFQNLKAVSSSMKYKFTEYAYESVTLVINLMVREFLTATCDNCAASGAKLMKVDHVPWEALQSKLLAGLYMNTPAAFNAIHPTTTPEEVVEEVAEETEETTEETEETTDAEDSSEETTKVVKPRLSQFISKTFKEITTREARFSDLLLSTGVKALVNDIIYQVMDRFANVIKSLLQTASSKTVNDRMAIIATKILLQDHIHSTDADVLVVLDVLQSRLEELKTKPAKQE